MTKFERFERKIWGTMDEPTTFACVMFFATIVGSLVFIIGGLLTVGC